jgi:hypothetical protein
MFVAMDRMHLAKHSVCPTQATVQSLHTRLVKVKVRLAPDELSLLQCISVSQASTNVTECFQMKYIRLHGFELA